MQEDGKSQAAVDLALALVQLNLVREPQRLGHDFDVPVVDGPANRSDNVE